jgi:hypothetical protein
MKSVVRTWKGWASIVSSGKDLFELDCWTYSNYARGMYFGQPEIKLTEPCNGQCHTRHQNLHLVADKVVKIFQDHTIRNRI